MEAGRSLTFQKNIMPPSSEWKSKISKNTTQVGGKLNLSDFLIGLLLTLKMEAICSSKMLGSF
jgi:hypothetical protein